MHMALSYKSFSCHPRLKAKFVSLPPCCLMESHHLYHTFIFLVVNDFSHTRRPTMRSKIHLNRIRNQHDTLGL
ncbi:hypothetical protein EUGRSUZ_C03810 [Eucalyptus grandis]|uniref:Uncharacterized protein n=2 Tax=Eucalyptus grandis TaxID=71139 RepID=A0ACC3LJS9_EUCGR|nr:hypothetical protein EUGRSUZ_C03810 [Eucalyptus grandis]